MRPFWRAAPSTRRVLRREDCPSVAVFDPIGGADAEPPVVSRVMITSPAHARFPSASSTSRPGLRALEAVGAGALVQLGDEVAGRGEHDRVEAAVAVGPPCGDSCSVVVAGSPTWTRCRSR